MMIWQSFCVRCAIAAGNRCNAGWMENTAASSSGSKFANSTTSSGRPSRRVSSNGAANARSSGICWSPSVSERRSGKVAGEVLLEMSEASAPS